MQQMMKRIVLSVALAGMAASLVIAAEAAEWPYWRGAGRTGISTETGWSKSWPAAGPKRLWTAQVGEGYSAVSVKGNRVYTMGSRGGKDTVYCLDANTGKPLWTYSYAHGQRHYGADPTPLGTTTTPTCDGNVVYTLSREGVAHCLNATTGKLLWQKDLHRETGGELPQWGYSGSPLVDSGVVIYNVGGAGIALDGGGRVVWKSRGGRAGYATPVPYSFGNRKAVALFSGKSIMGIDPKTGKQLWQHPWETSYDVNAADPIPVGDSMFISSGYNRGGALIKFGAGRPSVVWENRTMRNHMNGCVKIGGYLYGNDQNTLKCVDLKTGRKTWQQRGMGRGALIAADHHLIAMTERGELFLAKVNPGAYQEVARAKVMGGTCWTQPVLANGRIYCRNAQGELVCLDVRG